MSDPYEELGLSPDSDDEAIRRMVEAAYT